MTDEGKKLNFYGGIELIEQERTRQIEIEGYDARHDDHWTNEELANAAAFYALPEKYGELLAFWPWEPRFNKKRKHNRIKQLAIAGALIAAEIDRLNGVNHLERLNELVHEADTGAPD